MALRLNNGRAWLRFIGAALLWLWALPAFLFTLVHVDPEDPISRRADEMASTGMRMHTERLYEARAQHHLDLPVFYFSLASLADPEPHFLASLTPIRQKAVLRWSRLTRNPQGTRAALGRPDSLSYDAWLAAQPPRPVKVLSALRLFTPRLYFNGTSCRFHYWYANLWRGHLGNSFADGMPVSRHLAAALGFSLLLGMAGIFIGLVCGVQLGRFLFRHREKRAAAFLSGFLLMLYTVPVFVMAWLLIALFAIPGYLPVSGFGPPSYLVAADRLTRILQFLPYLLLPLVCYSYDIVAYLGRAIPILMADENNKRFVLAARARGLAPALIRSRYVWANARLPLLGIIARIFPAALSGTLIIETIFNLPGMGRELYNAILLRDYPVIVDGYMVILASSALSYLLSDVAARAADPRLKLSL